MPRIGSLPPSSIDRGFRFANGDAVPTVALSGERVTLTAAVASTAEAELPSDSVLICIRSTEAVWLRFGNPGMGEAAAGDDSILFPPGTEVIPVPSDGGDAPYTHVRVIRAGADDSLVQIEKIEMRN